MKICKIYCRFIAFAFCLFILGACGDDAPITKPVKIVAFGDSLTAGYRLPQEQSFPAQLQARFLKDGSTGVDVENQGISGDMTKDGVARLNKVLEAKPDIVILELGANDILRAAPQDKAKANLVLMITELQKAGIAVLLAGIRVSGIALLSHQDLGEYNTLFTGLGKEYGIVVYEDFLKDVLGRKDMTLEDGLHPNAAGVSRIVDNIYPLVEDLAQAAAKRKAG